MLSNRFTSIVLAAAFGLLGYFLYQSNKDNQQLVSKIDAMQAQINTLNTHTNPVPSQSGSLVLKTAPVPGTANLPAAQPANPMAAVNAMREQMHRQMQSMFGDESFDAFMDDDFFKEHFRNLKAHSGLGGTHALDYDVQERDNNYVYEFSSPDRKDLNLNIEVKSGALVVKEEKRNETTKQEQGGSYRSQTFSSSSFSIPLPKDADSHFTTKMEDGKFLVIVPKLA